MTLLPGLDQSGWRFDERQVRLLRRHRAPMLLIDRVDHCDVSLASLRALRCISVGDALLPRATHQPSLFPPTLVLEAAAQASGFLMCLRWLSQRGHDVAAFAAGRDAALIAPGGDRPVVLPYSVLAESRAQVLGSVRPGDLLLLHSRLLLQRGAMSRFATEASVAGNTCLRAELSLAFPEESRT